MDCECTKYKEYCRILQKELVPAFGCTEPIALAYGAAKAREILGEYPDQVSLEVCSNIIKNAKSVVVPNTDGLKGIEVSVIAGIIAGNSADKLEVLAHINDSQRQEIREYVTKGNVYVRPSDTPKQLYIDLTFTKGEHSSRVVIADAHTNIVLIERDGKTIHRVDEQKQKQDYDEAYGLLSVTDIVDFADSVNLEDIRELIERQISYNSAISKQGLEGNYGANIGKVMLNNCADTVLTKAIASAAAGSDARMSGCELPVVIVSGSGNQGLTASMPVVTYAREMGINHDKMLRSVALADLITIHQKTGIGKLSAYCGAISAGIGASAGIAYMLGGNVDTIAHTVVNGLAISSGIVCDGAKPSCAGKIATAIFAGMLGYNMYKNGQQFYAGDGIITKGVENTIKNIGQLAKEGMRETDKEILKIMTKK